MCVGVFFLSLFLFFDSVVKLDNIKSFTRFKQQNFNIVPTPIEIETENKGEKRHRER